MLISEIFYSIQGEGELTGVPSVFVRTSGCNLRCRWCDTKYASWNLEGEQKSVAEIVDRVCGFPGAHVVLTGGEPMVAKDIPPFTMAQGDRARLVGLNRIGLERHGMSAPDIARLKRLYREVFFGTGSLHERVRALLGSCTDFPAGREFLEFILGSKRGVAGPRRGAGAADEEG
jgi:hypothetical protein